jgi:hypothetical protein
MVWRQQAFAIIINMAIRSFAKVLHNWVLKQVKTKATLRIATRTLVACVVLLVNESPLKSGPKVFNLIA